MVEKVFAYILRENRQDKQLLAFEHKNFPDVPIQVPGGTLKEGEDPVEGLKREVWEESGLTDLNDIKKLGEADVESAVNGEKFHAYFFRCGVNVKCDKWDHVVKGDGEDEGLTFSYRWLDPQEALLVYDYYFHIFMRPRYLPDLFTEQSLLGLANDKISLMPHTGLWKREFLKEKDLLQKETDEVEIQHVGSTFVPWVPAKPIVDMAVKTEDPKDQIKNIENCGYQYRGEKGVKGRYYFVKGTSENRTHHIHMFEKGNQRYEDHLLFRNYLINNRDTAVEYGKLKLQLWRDHKKNRKKYTDEKSDFIEKTIKEARKENES